MYRFLLLIVALIVYGSLYPWHFALPPNHTNPLVVLAHSWPPQWDRFTLHDAYVNLEVYFPLGAIAFLALARRHKPAAAIAVALSLALALSTLTELVQVYLPGRTCSAFDVLCDLGGAALGTLAALSLQRIFGRSTYQTTRLAAPAIFLLACLAGNQFLPLFPLIRWLRLRTEIHILLHPDPLSAFAIWRWTAEWFVVLWAIQSLMGRTRLLWLLIALGVRIAVRPFLVTRPLELDEVLGATLAWLLWQALNEKLRVRAGIFMLGSVILWRGLLPLHFSNTPSGVSWVPFQNTLSQYREFALVILLRDAFDYGAMVWLLHRAGISYLRAGALLVTALALIEGIRCYFPDTAPSTTAPTLALLITLFLWLIDGWYASSTRNGPLAALPPKYASH